MYSLYEVLLYLNYFLLFINSVLGFVKYSYFIKSEKFYVFYIFFLFCIEMTVWWLSSGLGFTDTLFMYPIYIAGDFFLLTSLFYSKLKLNKIFVAASAFLSFAFLIAVFGFKIEFNHDIAKVISNIIIICLAGIFLIMQIRNGKKAERFFFADLGVFFYYSVSVFNFVIQQQLQNLSKEDYALIGIFNTFFAAVLYGLITYTFLKLKK
ncbi:hypothetical protein ASG31_12550 [Chryseobacterium sp. Leaf404]|uniref:hypothetical protein n=1 Tax=unclassified Chryseobacterium TaxID=2593645 RepID=UPI0006FDFC42|nr:MULTISPECIES: hypothetical protein [unclassified Chryseobacterium]KQT16341.1 hypothetical protein ASG31_12550 [Chryseobacterium sp. Leaf404]